MRFEKYKEQHLVNLHACFERAFSDYQVPFKLSYDAFRKRMSQKCRVRPELSVLIWEDDLLIGFILHSMGNYSDKLTIYNAGTGLIQDYRGQGIMSKAYQWIMPQLRKTHAEQIVLEVIEKNKNAIRVYQKLGFEPQLRYLCFKAETRIQPVNHTFKITSGEKYYMKNFRELLSYQPSFLDCENQLSINLENEEILCAYDGAELTGFIIYQSHNGRVSQYGAKNEPVGRTLFYDVQNKLESKIKMTVMNISEENLETINFLIDAGFQHQVTQWEMTLSLQSNES